MRRSTFVWALAGGGVAAAIAVALLSSKKPRVALVGDSLAVGLGPEMAKLAAAQGTAFRYEGHTGSTVAQWLAMSAWGAWITDFAPTITLIELGTNDYLNPAPSLAQYRQLAAKFPGAVWVMPPNETATSLDKVRATIAAVGVPVIAAATIPIGPDGFHPVSYGAWAKTIWSAIT